MIIHLKSTALGTSELKNSNKEDHNILVSLPIVVLQIRRRPDDERVLLFDSFKFCYYYIIKKKHITISKKFKNLFLYASLKTSC